MGKIRISTQADTGQGLALQGGPYAGISYAIRYGRFIQFIYKSYWEKLKLRAGVVEGEKVVIARKKHRYDCTNIQTGEQVKITVTMRTPYGIQFYVNDNSRDLWFFPDHIMKTKFKRNEQPATNINTPK
jgi:uncharacterized protein YneR